MRNPMKTPKFENKRYILVLIFSIFWHFIFYGFILIDVVNAKVFFKPNAKYKIHLTDDAKCGKVR